MTKRDLLLLIPLALAALLVYTNGLKGEFLYDDLPWITKNRQVTGEQGIFTSSTPPGKEHLGLYRPVSMLSFRINYLLAGEFKPSSFHGTNLLIHVLVVAALFGLIRIVTQDRAGAFLGALLFAVHPVHVEAVTWLVGRAELLSFLFCLLAALFHFGARKRRLWVLPEAACFVLAALSKENALAFPLVLWILERWSYRKGDGFGRADTLRGYWIYAPLLIGVLILRYIVLGGLGPHIETAPFKDVTLVGRIEVAFASFAEYLRLFILPYPLKIFYHRSEIRDLTLIRLVLLLLFLGLLFLTLKKRNGLFGWLLWIPAALVTVLNLVPIGSPFAERFFYLPSAGGCAAAGLGIMTLIRFEKEKRGSHLSLWIPLIILLAFGLLTFARNPAFDNSFKLWKDAVSKNEEFAFPHYNLGECYLQAEIFEQQSLENRGALWEFHKSLALNPDHPYAFSAHYGLGIIYLERYFRLSHVNKEDTGDLIKGIQHHKKAIELAPPLYESNWKPMLALARAYFLRRGPDHVPLEEARDYARKAGLSGAPELEVRRLMNRFASIEGERDALDN